MLPALGNDLIYFAVLIRAIAWYQGSPWDGFVIGLLAGFGLVLLTEPFLSRQRPDYRGVYLGIQTLLVIVLLLNEPEMDFLPALFIPLSFQAVSFFGRRAGFIWMGVSTLAIAGPILIGWNWELPGLAMIFLFAGLYFLMGSFAYFIQRSKTALQENQRLLEELQQAHRKLQDYAAQKEELAAAQERSHMAQELHDSVTQTLFSMNLSVQAARMLADTEPARMPDQLDRLEELARSAMGEIQVLVRQLRSHSVVDGGLANALKRLAADRLKRDGLQIHLEITGEKDLPADVTTGLYRITQEALNNVARHSGAAQAELRLNLEAQPPYLEIEDQGRGFEQGMLAHKAGHLGLSGIAERAREVGWCLDIATQPGQGTCIRVEECLEVQTANE